MNKVLIVDASESDRRLMSGLLVKSGYEQIAVNSMEAAKEEVAKLPPGAVVVTAMKFAHGTAQELVNWQKREGYKFPVIAIVDNLNPLEIADVMKDRGAVDIIQRRAMDKQLLETVSRYSKSEKVLLTITDDLIPRQSEAFRRIEKSIRAIAATNTNAIIFGECGTGKEQIAKQIYLHSSRSQKPCTIIEAGGAALVGEHDPTTLRSEIYNRMEGYFKKADGGTIIIKNVQLLSFDKQSVLLHILENEHPDVRVICTAGMELLKMVSEKTFRSNLFYILRQIDIVVPPLREVTEDISPLADYFLTSYAHSTGHPRKHLDASALKALKVYPFTGNVRELKDVVLFAAFHTSADVISTADLSFSNSGPEPDSSFKLQDPTLEKAKILAALEQSQGNKTMAAKLLKIDRTTLYVKMRQYGLK
ncbi:sigma-54-dependent transcriptional regulator [Xylanibacter rodentium]|uniref:sigma-54-dependent transcriptional regulator n=1 Tax=Xylanibacter rodentium TaxID=2736289 RepID=UPI002587E200|nr:sigma 54-interacting transcriptional regulator [Xylanibacter rodentium]